MSQDKPVSPIALLDALQDRPVESGAAVPEKCVRKPVAAQEPIFWACYAKDKLVEVTNNLEYVHSFKANFPSTGKVVELFSNVAPCARCAELEAMSRQSNQDHLNARKDYQAKITEQAALIEKISIIVGDSALKKFGATAVIFDLISEYQEATK